MPLDGGEVVAQAIQQTNRACQELRSAVAELGTGRDAVARDKLRRIRQQVKQYDDKCANVLLFGAESGSGELRNLQEQYKQAKTVFEDFNSEALRRERQTFRQQQSQPTTHASSWQQPGAAIAGTLEQRQQQQGGTEVVMERIRPVDLSSLRTEEAIQREKLWNAREIESDVMDLKTTYQEFNSLVNQQQSGVDIIADNTAESRNLISRGHGELRHASRSQKRFRKVGCIVAIVVAIVLVIVIIVVIVATKK